MFLSLNKIILHGIRQIAPITVHSKYLGPTTIFYGKFTHQPCKERINYQINGQVINICFLRNSMHNYMKTCILLCAIKSIHCSYSHQLT